MSRERFSVTVEGWRSLGDGLEANAADHPNFEPLRLQLKEMTARAFDLVTQRNALESQKQAVTNDEAAQLYCAAKICINHHRSSDVAESLGRHDPTGVRGASDHRHSKRIFTLDARPGRRSPGRLRGARDRLRALRAARPRVSDGTLQDNVRYRAGRSPARSSAVP